MSAHSCNKWCKVDEDFHRLQKDNDWFPPDDESARDDLIEYYKDMRDESQRKIEKLEL